MEENNNKNLSRRDFLRRLGMGAGAVMATCVGSGGAEESGGESHDLSRAAWLW